MPRCRDDGDLGVEGFAFRALAPDRGVRSFPVR